MAIHGPREALDKKSKKKIVAQQLKEFKNYGCFVCGLRIKGAVCIVYAKLQFTFAERILYFWLRAKEPKKKSGTSRKCYVKCLQYQLLSKRNWVLNYLSLWPRFTRHLRVKRWAWSWERGMCVCSVCVVPSRLLVIVAVHFLHRCERSRFVLCYLRGVCGLGALGAFRRLSEKQRPKWCYSYRVCRKLAVEPTNTWSGWQNSLATIMRCRQPYFRRDVLRGFS